GPPQRRALDLHKRRAGDGRPPEMFSDRCRWSCRTSFEGLSLSDTLNEQIPRPRQPRHYGADWREGDFGDLAVAQAVYLTQHQCLAKGNRQSGDSILQKSGVSFGNEGRLGCRLGLLVHSGSRLLENAIIVRDDQRFWPVLAKPSKRRVADDRQEPRAGVADGLSFERAECPNANIRHNVFGIVPVACEPAGERKSIVEVRQHHLAKPLPCLL